MPSLAATLQVCLGLSKLAKTVVTEAVGLGDTWTADHRRSTRSEARAAGLEQGVRARVDQTLTASWSATPQYSSPCSSARNSPTGNAKLPKCSDTIDLQRCGTVRSGLRGTVLDTFDDTVLIKAIMGNQGWLCFEDSLGTPYEHNGHPII